MHAEADSEENLWQIQDLLTARLESFGRREQLTVTWQQLAAADPGQQGTADFLEGDRPG